MTRQLLLSPDALPLWRDDTTLQFGVESALTLHDPDAYLIRLAEALECGASRETLDNIARAYDAGPADVDKLLSALRGAVLDGAVRPQTVTLLGFGDVTVEELGRVGLALDGSDDIRSVPEASSADVVVLLARHAVFPRDAARWLRRDIPHLPVALGARRIEIGPLILPGVTACVACLAQHERDRDAAWPLLVAQLTGRRASHTSPALLTEAGVGIAALLNAARPALAEYLSGQRSSRQNEDEDRDRSMSLIVDADRIRTWRPRPPHRDCGCRFP